jgi:hypothetical protein
MSLNWILFHTHMEKEKRNCAYSLTVAQGSQCWAGLGPSSRSSPFKHWQPMMPGARPGCSNMRSPCQSATTPKAQKEWWDGGPHWSGAQSGGNSMLMRKNDAWPEMESAAGFFSCRGKRWMLDNQFDPFSASKNGKEGAHHRPVGGSCVMCRGRRRKGIPALKPGAKQAHCHGD